MQVSGGLVGQDQLGISSHRARHSHQLLLSTGKLVGIKVFFSHDLEAVQDVSHHGGALGARYVPVRKRDVNIFLYRQVVEQMVALKNKTDISAVQLCALLAVQLVDRLLQQKVFA